MSKQEDRFRQIIPADRDRAIVLVDPENIRYIAGVSFFNGCIVGHNGSIIVFTDITWFPMVKRYSYADYVYCAERSAWLDALLWLKQKSINVLDYEPYKMPIIFRNLAETILPDLSWVDSGRRIASMRMIKTAKEIENIKEATHASDAGIAWLKTVFKDGISEKEAARKLDTKLMWMTGEPPFFKTIVAFGENTLCPHWNSSSRKLQLGDTILVDWGASVNGYGSDLTRIFFWKKASACQRRRYRIVRQTLNSLISAVKLELPTAELDMKARIMFTEYGMEKAFIHPVGHGLGLEIHEIPFFSMDSEDQIMINMVFALEPGLYISGWGGIRLEETIVMTVDGPSVMSGDVIEEMPILK